MSKQIYGLLLTLFLGLSPVLSAQMLSTAADTLALANFAQFPQASATMIISFNAEMLDLQQIPKSGIPKESLESMLTKHESDSGKEDIDLMISIFNAYYDKNEPNKGYPYLQKAYDLSIKRYDENPSDIQILEQISRLMLIVNRLGDLPILWKGFATRNPEQASAWAQLAMYEIQLFDTVSANEHLEKAYKLDPKLPEIYVTALLGSMFKYVRQLSALLEQGDEEKLAALEMDLRFLERAVAENPKQELPKMAIQSAKLIKIFYETMLSNAPKFAEQERFQLRIPASKMPMVEELEAYMKATLQNSKIVNKFFPLKSLVILEILKGNMPQAQFYLEESKKFILEDIDLYKLMAYGYLPQKQYKNAIPYLKKTVALSPSYDELFALARIYFENYQYDEATLILQDLLKAYPQRFDVIFGMVAVEMRERRFNNACQLLGRMNDLYAEEVDFNKNEYYSYYKTICLIVAGKKDLAHKEIRAHIQANKAWKTEAEKLLKRFL